MGPRMSDIERMLGQQLQALLHRDHRVAEHFVGLYAVDQDWKVPCHLPASYVFNKDSVDGPGEHWLAVFISADGTVDYFDSYGTAPLEPIYKRLVTLGHADIRYNTRMLQGPISKSCGLYCAYFLHLRSYAIPMHAITSPFREYDFTYNEKLIRDLAAVLWPSKHHKWPGIARKTSFGSTPGERSGSLGWLYIFVWNWTMENMADYTEAKKPGSCHFAQRWWCAQGVTTPKTGHPPGRRGQKWIPALGGSLVLLIVLGLAIASVIKRGGPPIAWDHGGAVAWNMTST